jgi:pimeloyl-ACP methyl ester carboxylesterase
MERVMRKTARNPLVLDHDDRRVTAAKEAERRFFRHYGLETETRYVPLERYGIRVRAVETGTGTPLVMVPGNTGDGFPFIPLIARLANHRIIVINRPGGGLSDGMNHGETDFRRLAVDTITAVFDSFGIEKAPVVAHSMGGHWSLWFAIEKPERLEALILPGVPGNVLDTRPPFALRLASLPGLNRLLFRMISSGPEEKALRSLQFMGHSAENLKKLPAELAECYFRFQRLPFYGISSLSLMETANGLFGAKKAAHITGEELRGVKAGVLLIWGENDPFGKTGTGRRIAELLPKGSFREMPGGGHLPWLDDPDFVAERIHEFLAAASGANGPGGAEEPDDGD